jgi:hypothetical protein
MKVVGRKSENSCRRPLSLSPSFTLTALFRRTLFVRSQRCLKFEGDSNFALFPFSLLPLPTTTLARQK